MNLGQRILVFILIIITVFSIVLVAYEKGVQSGKSKQNHSQINIYPSVEESLELTPENVLYWLNVFEMQYPEIVLKQSILECGWNYDSYRVTEHNNIFGFETSTGALSFGHWIGSVIYYKKWQDEYYMGGDYYQFLQEYGYAEDSLYIYKLKHIKL